MEKTSLNIDENIESLLCYVGLWITGLIFLLIEKENKTVKFHAKQSLLLFLPLTIIGIIFTLVGGITSITYTQTVYGNLPTGISQPFVFLIYLAWIIWLISIILMVILIVTAYQGQKFKIPIVGDLAEK